MVDENPPLMKESFKKYLYHLGVCSSTLCDFDEPLLPSIEPFFYFLAKRLGSHRKFEEFREYMPFAKFFGVSQELIHEIETEYFHSEEYKKLVLDPQAIAVLTFIRGHATCEYIDIASARHKEHLFATEVKLQAVPHLFRNVTHLRNAENQNACKATHVSTSGNTYGIFVEDAAHTAVAMATKYNRMVTFVPRRRWNVHLEQDAPPNVMVVEDMEQVADIIAPYL